MSRSAACFNGRWLLLHALHRKRIQFTWTEEHQDAFNRLKERLTSAPVLGMPTNEGTYCLDCDASDVGLGTVLSYTVSLKKCTNFETV